MNGWTVHADDIVTWFLDPAGRSWRCWSLHVISARVRVRRIFTVQPESDVGVKVAVTAALSHTGISTFARR